MEINRENLLSLIKTGIRRGGLSMSGLERQANVPRDTIRDFMRGKTQVLRADKLQKIMRVLEPQDKLRISGYVGARAEIAAIEAGTGEEVDCPPGYEPSDIVAVSIKGNAMLPIFHDGWVIYYSRNNDHTIPPISGGWQVPYGISPKSGKPFTEFLGKPCVIGLGDGRTLLGILKRSATKNRYDLISHNASDYRNIRPAWAAKIIFIKTS